MSKLKKLKATRSPFPERVQPMLATKTKKPFNDEEWIFEVKWDGYRIIAHKRGKDVRLHTRAAQNYSAVYSTITESLKRIAYDAVLDGEVIMLDDNGKPSFDLLQKVKTLGPERLIYCVFDIVWLQGYSLLDIPLSQRKQLLRSVIPENLSHVIVYDYIEGEGKKLFNDMLNKDMEGIVAKRKDSVYVPGERSGNWLKIQTKKRQEFVIGGWTESTSGRPLRSLIFGYYDKDKKLNYFGHSGAGFSEKQAAELKRKFQKIELKRKPFINKVDTETKAHWIKPIHVAEFEYATTTQSGKVRKPAIFKGLRTDKKAADVTLEIADKEVNKSEITSVEKPEKNNGLTRKNEDSHWPELIESTKKSSLNELEIEGEIIALNNIEKILWRRENINKAALIKYYIEIAPYILPYLKDRPLSLHIKNNGIKAPGMYIKDMEGYQPEFAEIFTTKRKHRKAGKRDVIDYLVCNNLPTLIYAVNLGCIDLNPWNSTISKPLNPNYLVIDLDPTDSPFAQVVETAVISKKTLDKLKLKAVVKTSGKTGIHIFVPCKPIYSYHQARTITSRICQAIHAQIPDITTIEDSIAKRGNKVFIDDNQNDEADTVASAYSVRPYEKPTVSTPLDWNELSKKLDPANFTIDKILKRVQKKGDLFRGLFDTKIMAANTIQLKKFI